MARPGIPLLWLLSAASAAPVTKEGLDLLPGLWPRERRALYARVQEAPDVARALREAGIDATVVDCLEALEPGPLLAERQGHALVLSVPDLSDGQRALLRHLVTGVEAAERALLAHRDRLLRELPRPDGDPLPRHLRESFDREIHGIERRFWRIAHLALATPQAAALKKRLPPALGVADLMGHVYLLPGLTPSQGARVQAIAREFESETAADRAELDRLRARGAPAAETDPVGDRVADALRSALERGRAIFTEEQALLLDALPPHVTPQDRTEHPGEMVKAMAPRPEQRTKLEGLGDRVRREAEAAQAAAREGLAALEGEVGPEAPQAATMMMMHAGAQAASVAAMEAAAREALLEVLEPEQVLRWVVAPG